jgi:hypothetical protein
LFRRGLKWDEDYDKGIACENNQLALDARLRYNARIVLDGLNHAISLPHRTYFEEEEQIGSEENLRNMRKYEKAFKRYKEAEEN